MSIDGHLDLFKADWISGPEQLKTLARKSKYNDLFTAEIAAWCAEVHEHLRDLEQLMTLASTPVGIDEDRRQDAVPRQLYDLDLLLAAFTREVQWQTMVAYCTTRYARECAHWKVDVAAGEPSAGVQQRLARWAACTDPQSQHWKTIRSVQQSQLRREVHRAQWGWHARCVRLATATRCIELEDGWTVWQQALTTAAIVPTAKPRRFKGALAELSGTDVRSLPLELHDFVWDALSAGEAPIEERIVNARTILSAV